MEFGQKYAQMSSSFNGFLDKGFQIWLTLKDVLVATDLLVTVTVTFFQAFPTKLDT